MIIGLGLLLLIWGFWILLCHWEWIKEFSLPKDHPNREGYGECFKVAVLYPFGMIVCFGFALVSCIGG